MFVESGMPLGTDVEKRWDSQPLAPRFFNGPIMRRFQIRGDTSHDASESFSRCRVPRQQMFSSSAARRAFHTSQFADRLLEESP